MVHLPKHLLDRMLHHCGAYASLSKVYTNADFTAVCCVGECSIYQRNVKHANHEAIGCESMMSFVVVICEHTVLVIRRLSIILIPYD